MFADRARVTPFNRTVFDNAIDQVLADQTFDTVSHAEILAILARHDSVDYALAAAYRYADLARALVTDLPESDERRALLWMPDFVVARDK